MSFLTKFFGKAKTEVADRVEGEGIETKAPRKIFKGPMSIVAGLAIAAGSYVTLGQIMASVDTDPLPETQLTESQSHLVDTMGRLLGREYRKGWAPSARLSPLSTRTDLKAFQHGIHDFMKLLSQRMPSMFTLSGNQSSGIRLLNEAMTDLGRDFDSAAFVVTADDTGTRVGDAAEKYARFNSERTNAGRHSLEPRIDTAAEFVNIIIPQYRELSDWLQGVVESGVGVREAYYYAQGYLYATHEGIKAFKADFLPVLDRQASLTVIDKLIADSQRSLPYNPLIVLNGSGFGYTGGNVQAILGVVSGVHADLKVLQDSLAAGASRGGYDAPSKSANDVGAKVNSAQPPRAGLGSK